ncbi:MULTISPECIES: bacteriophage spanin2 family protein [Antrihabitans]|jgi:hypothetical protein|uniref:Bacteriophage spanin2 family protein n=2 Tax=Antrihabitans TaxID=2799491 RepID=A0A934U2U3_9NOCA|nr:bacteriophage spanin2 family protein [Antrihabitans stalagmiti]MBJ8339240.1 bacteriophage spanin2 family protein [Antrihabitans stalagmiti]
MRLRQHVRRSVTAAFVAAPFAVLVLSGCETLDQAAATVDKAGVCVDALQAANFTPDVNNPDISAQNAADAAQKLSDLAGQTTDVTLQDALEAMSSTISQMNVGDLNPQAIADWTQQKADLYQSLSSACR